MVRVNLFSAHVGYKDFDITTKISSKNHNVSDYFTWTIKQTTSCLERLRVQSIDTLLLHSAEDWYGTHGEERIRALRHLQDLGVIDKIGVSVYEPRELQEVVLQALPDVVQIPFNLVDQRMVNSGWMERLRSLGVEIHVRSIFLQGLLLFEQNELPLKFSRWRHIWEALDEFNSLNGTDTISVCLAFVLGFPEVSRVVVGVDSFNQFNDLILKAQNPIQLTDFPNVGTLDSNIIDPRQWAQD